MTTIEAVEYLITQVPVSEDSYVLLVLLYWKLFDNIDIPLETMKQIIINGTSPESISRAKRIIKERENGKQ